MYPIIFKFGDFVVPSWHLFYVIGAFAAFFYLHFLNSRMNHELEENLLNHLYIVVYFAGYLGARALSILVEIPDLSLTIFMSELISLGSVTFYGGFLGGGLAGVCFCLYNKVNIIDIADRAVPSLFAALIFGRLGCFLNGDDYGSVVPKDLFFLGISNPVLEDNLPRYPVQVYESILVAFPVIFLALKVWKNKKVDLYGVSKKFIGYYAIVRFFLEYIRGDDRGWWIQDHISTSQGISLLLLSVLGIVYCMDKLQSKSPSST